MPLHLRDDIYRIYFGAYDILGRGRIFSLDLDLSAGLQITNLVTQPVVNLGATGFFDDNGIIPSAVVRLDDTVYLYTIGFSIKNRLLFDAATGLAISRDGGQHFTKLSGPVLDRGVDDPCFAASPIVVHDHGHWRMWYVSCDHWQPLGDGFRHYYNIKHRRSRDGIYWEPRATVCIDYANEYEYAISRPSVLRDSQGGYRMWYSFRAQPDVDTYRIGYAESCDGLNWTRLDKFVGIDVSAEGWDAEMICYPYVFEHFGRLYMLYNGDGYGKTGFGLAVMEELS